VTRATFWRAWSIWAVTMAITATAMGYDALHPLPAKQADQSGNGLDMVVGLTFIIAFATVGALLAWKKPGNPIGWLLSGSGLAYALGGFGLMLMHFPQTLILGNWLGWAWLVGLGLCVFVVLLFPAGSLPSRRWRPVAWAAGQAWPAGSWATRSPPGSCRRTRRSRTRSA
jgi:two-component system NarL family sensor kinase